MAEHGRSPAALLLRRTRHHSRRPCRLARPRLAVHDLRTRLAQPSNLALLEETRHAPVHVPQATSPARTHRTQSPPVPSQTSHTACTSPGAAGRASGGRSACNSARAGRLPRACRRRECLTKRWNWRRSLTSLSRCRGTWLCVGMAEIAVSGCGSRSVAWLAGGCLPDRALLSA